MLKSCRLSFQIRHALSECVTQSVDVVDLRKDQNICLQTLWYIPYSKVSHLLIVKGFVLLTLHSSLSLSVWNYFKDSPNL